MPNYNPYQTQQQVRLPYADPTLLKGRPVTSIEEVRAAPIDFDGSIFYFPDMTNNRIYTKQINMDGTASFKVYEFKPMPIEPAPNMQNFITREEFESVVSQLRQLIPPPKQQTAENIANQF